MFEAGGYEGVLCLMHQAGILMECLPFLNFIVEEGPCSFGRNIHRALSVSGGDRERWWRDF